VDVDVGASLCMCLSNVSMRTRVFVKCIDAYACQCIYMCTCVDMDVCACV